MIIIAIDPGAKGGIAWRDEEGDVHVADLPVITIEGRRKRKNGDPSTSTVCDPWALAKLIYRAIINTGEQIYKTSVSVVIESLPRMSGGKPMTSQAVNHGRTVGAVEGCLATMGLRFAEVRLVQPEIVRRFHGLKAADKAIPKNRRSDANKAANVAKACELFPDAPIVIPAEPTKSGAPSRRKPTIKDGRADALLMLVHHEHVLREENT